MSYRKRLLVAATTLLASLLSGTAFSRGPAKRIGQAERPNILLILADDLGIEGVGAYGSDSFETPNIDRLADEGMMFTRAFANPYCTPSRSELLTGRYPFATGTAEVIWNSEQHGHQILSTAQPSFARQLQNVGYSTAIAGKWQLSFLAQQDRVHEFGFDSYLLWQLETADGERTTRYHEPHFRKDGRVIADEIADRYGPDVLVDYLIEFIEEKHTQGPFMAYYTALLPHFPWVPTPDSPDQTMPEDEWDGDAKFFPDMVARLDFNVGRLLDALDRLGIAENTIVIFMSDNGTDQRQSASINGTEVRGGKGTLTDRGTLVPLLIRWPRVIAPGAVDHDFIELADFLPTFSELAGAPPPEQPIHGESFAARLRQNELGREKPWVHIQMAQDRYLRTNEWIVTNNGRYQKVRPYPLDATDVRPDDLSGAEQGALRLLERQLIQLDGSADGTERRPQGLR